MATTTKKREKVDTRPSPVYFGEAGMVLTNPKYKRWFVKELARLDGILDSARMQFLDKPGWEIPASLIEALECLLLHLGQPALGYTPEFDPLLQVATALCRALDRASAPRPWQECGIDDLSGQFWTGVVLRLHEAVLKTLTPGEDAPSGPKMLETLRQLIDAKLSDRQIAVVYDWRQPNGQEDLERVAAEKAEEGGLDRAHYAPVPEKTRANPQRTQHAGLLEFMAAQIEAYRDSE